MKELKLEYIGRSNFDNKLYKDEEETYFIKDDYNDIIYLGKDPDNDPYTSIKNINKYKDCKIIITGDENLPTEADRFNYMMLGRLEADCKYYLGYGHRNKKDLWATNEIDHIQEMKKIYNSFADDKKPEWLTWENILEYESQML